MFYHQQDFDEIENSLGFASLHVIHRVLKSTLPFITHYFSQMANFNAEDRSGKTDHRDIPLNTRHYRRVARSCKYISY